MGGRKRIESAYLERYKPKLEKASCLSQSMLKQGEPPTPPPPPQPPVADAPKWTNLKSTPLPLHSNLQGYNRLCFHMCREVWNLLNLESHNPPEKIKTYIHLKTIQRQIKQLSNPVCLGQGTIKNSRLAWLELLPSFPPITEQGVGHPLL